MSNLKCWFTNIDLLKDINIRDHKHDFQRYTKEHLINASPRLFKTMRYDDQRKMIVPASQFVNGSVNKFCFSMKKRFKVLWNIYYPDYVVIDQKTFRKDVLKIINLVIIEYGEFTNYSNNTTFYDRRDVVAREMRIIREEYSILKIAKRASTPRRRSYAGALKEEIFQYEAA